MWLRAQVLLGNKADVVYLASLLPTRWSDFIRNAPDDDVRPMGTRRLPQQPSAWGPGGRSSGP